MMKMYQKILIAMIVGVVSGWLLPELTVIYKPIGTLFIRALKFLIVPLVLASLVSGVVSLGDFNKLGRIGAKTFVYFLLTTLVAISTGLILAVLIQPGMVEGIQTAATFSAPQKSSFIQVLYNIIPTNMVDALASGNMLAIIFMSILIGFGLTKLKSLPIKNEDEKNSNPAQPLINVFESINQLMMVVTDWVLRTSPIGIWALIAQLIATTGLATLKPLAIYIMTVLIGLLVHALVVIPVIVSIMTKKKPLDILRQNSAGVLTAFSAASSAASLPLVLQSLVSRTNVSQHVTSFVMPLGITVNMNGTALYQAVATVFIAQLYGIVLEPVQFLLILVTATLAAVSAAAIPSAGLITLTMILTTVGVPIEGIAIILGVDRIVDMCRTSVNIWGNCCASVVIDQLEGGLKQKKSIQFKVKKKAPVTKK